LIDSNDQSIGAWSFVYTLADLKGCHPTCGSIQNKPLAATDLCLVLVPLAVAVAAVPGAAGVVAPNTTVPMAATLLAVQVLALPSCGRCGFCCHSDVVVEPLTTSLLPDLRCGPFPPIELLLLLQ